MVAFGATKTVTGTVATDGAMLFRFTTWPLGPAAALSVRVIVADPPWKVNGSGDKVSVFAPAVIVTVAGTLAVSTSLTINCTT